MTPTITKPKVAIVQNRWRDDYEDNLVNVLQMIDDLCHAHKVDLICLPEFFMGPPWMFPGKSKFKGQMDDTIPGRIIDSFCEKAARYDTHILCGSMIEIEGDKYYNTAALVDNRGHIIGKARKIHIYASEMVHLERGEELFIADTALGKIGVCICADFWIQEMPRMLALNGAEIICIPGGSLVQNIDITRPCIQANSTHNLCYTVYASLVGKATGERAGRTITVDFGGYSTLAGPEHLLGTLDGDEGVLIGDLDIEYIRTMRNVDPTYKRTLYWNMWGRLPERYGDLLKPYVGAADQDLKTLLLGHLV
jgi:predicted amidohydrolase